MNSFSKLNMTVFFQAALDSRTLKWRDSVRLTSCVGFVLSVLPVPDIMDYLDVVLAPHIQELQGLAQHEVSGSGVFGSCLSS